MRVAVAGGTGQVGRPVITALKANGHEAIPLSRSSGVDLMTGAGLAPALEGVASVVDVTNTTDTERADTEHFFGTVSATLLNAEQQAGIGHHVVLSIAGVDRIEGNGHYFGKRREEQVVRDGPVPWTIQRAAQFFEFAAMMVSWTAHDGTAVIPPLLMQPVAAEDVGKVLAELAVGPSLGMAPDLVGPQQEDLVDMARRVLTARGDTTRLVPSWRNVPIGVEAAGELLLPGEGARVAETSFDAWLVGAPGPAWMAGAPSLQPR
ncbi:MAG TPA: NmrA family transcriptional regulator [Trebonia sp.]|jgi:uncharacterized protein YbjT (DUF2867 family)